MSEKNPEANFECYSGDKRISNMADYGEERRKEGNFYNEGDGKNLCHDFAIKMVYLICNIR